MTLRDVRWAQPIRVTLPSGLQRLFGSVYEALDFLENEWPRKRGKHHDQAVASCLRALKRAGSFAVAREHFVAACREVNMPVSNSVPTSSAAPRTRPHQYDLSPRRQTYVPKG